ncbi:PHB depolymerase family esterase [Actinoplanes sp. N902-109]|uniref:alpha/beta hydrolase family esterase n=1 Tax=Actinoplanes sp. (strain N902-109) TaxID=649831 RepID=UPI0003295D24|nr:PHB depolymerase family esterase [Actinoplanes sp. N902-109]AGL16860.1 hypothetical protein L083_3350 [Actinoplanes sp. N902-109]
MSATITVHGTPRTYEVAGPAGGAPGRSLVIVFHGSKQTGAKHRQFTGRAYDTLAADGAAVVAYPDGYRGNWNDGRRGSSFPARRDGIDDVALTRRLIDDLARTHGIDPARVYTVGFSNGGQMVMRLIHEAPELIAGAAVIAATMPAPDNFLAGDGPAVPMPTLLIHGTKDPISKYAGGTFSWWARKAFKVDGRNLSAPQTAEYFAARNGITAAPTTTMLPAATRGTTVERTDFRQPGRPPVALLTVHGGGHTIPGPANQPFVLGRTNHDLDTAGLLAGFFGIANPTGVAR